MHYLALSNTVRSASIAMDFQDWLSTSGGDELLNAVELLGGPAWQTTARRAIGAARNDELVRHLPQLRRLRQLLQLDLVDTCDELAGRFSAVNPDDPRADNARRCAEALDRGIRALERATPVRSQEAA